MGVRVSTEEVTKPAMRSPGEEVMGCREALEEVEELGQALTGL